MTTECLHLFLPATPGAPLRAFQRSASGLVSEVSAAPDALHSHVAAHPGNRVVAWVPAADCLFTSLTINARQLKQAGNALAWLLEDQVGEEVENLHMVQAPQQLGDVVPLLVVADTRMEEWLQAFQAAGLRPETMLPDVLLLPLTTSLESRQWTLACVDAQVWLRTGVWQGAAIEQDAMLALLDSALEETASEDALVLQVLGADEAARQTLEAWSQQCRDRGLSVTLVFDTEFGGDLSNLLMAVDPLVAQRNPFNLLQGDHAQRRHRGLAPAWRVAAAFVAVAYCIQLASDWTGYFYYHSRALKAQTAAVQAYKQIFPNEHRIVSLRKQMEAHLQGGGSQSTMLTLLTRFGQGIQGSGLQPQRLDFDAESKSLSIDVDAANLGQLQSIKQKLEQQGMTIDLSSANPQGSGVRGRFKITAGAA